MTGDKVIKFVPGKKIMNTSGVMTLPTISQWYSEDPERNHLGMMQLFGQMSSQQYMYGIMPDIMKNRQILTVGRDGKFTYDIPIYEEKSCMTVEDTSDQPFPGQDGTTFEIVLSEEFKPGDVLTYDPLYGEDIIVDRDSVVEMTSTGFLHTVKLVTQNQDAWFPAAQLSAGISYVKINHSLFGELDDKYSSIHMPETSGYYRCEFELGSGAGVEGALTEKADRSFSGARASTGTKEYLDKLQEQADRMGDVAVLMDINPVTKAPNVKSARLASTIEILVRKELEKLLATSFMFQKAGVITGTNGHTRLNEGVWHQLRRGKLIKYARPMGMTRMHIKEAVEYLYRENPLPPEERYITFECGSEMEHNFNEIFSQEINAQLGRENGYASGVLFGDAMQLPKSPISYMEGHEGDLSKLKKEKVAFRQVYLPGIGNVGVKVNRSLDYITDVDRFSAGFHPYKKHHTTYSAIIWDAMDQNYSNNKKLPEGTKLIENGKEGANIYMVKYEGDLVISGSEQGRYNPYQSSSILSSYKQRGVNYWAYGNCAPWIPDVGRFCMIELDPAARKGYM